MNCKWRYRRFTEYLRNNILFSKIQFFLAGIQTERDFLVIILLVYVKASLNPPPLQTNIPDFNFYI